MKKRLQIVGVLVVVVCVFVGVAYQANALTGEILDRTQQTADQIGKTGFGEDATDNNLTARIATIVRVAVSMIGAVIVFYIVYAGFLWTTAGGGSEQVEKAKKMMVQAIIGMALVLSAYAITNFVIERVVRSNMTEEIELERGEIVKDGVIQGYGDPAENPGDYQWPGDR